MIETNLALLEQAQLIRQAHDETEAAYLFKHGLVQESAYDSLLKHDRKRLHRFVAGVLEIDYPNALDELAPLLARHWDDAEEPQRALNYYLRAGDSAAHKYANAEAMLAFERARELAHEIEITSAQAQDLFAQRGRVLEWDGKYDAALANYQELEGWAIARGDVSLELDALNRRTTLYSTPSRLFDLERGEALAQQALALARRSGDRAGEAKVLWNLLLLNHFAGHFKRAIEYGEASFAIAQELNLREQQAYALSDLVRPYASSGKIEEALAVSQRARVLWRELGNLPMLADNLTTFSWHAYFGGQLQSALADLHEALHITREIGNLWGESFAAETIGMIYFQLGELGNALDYLREATEIGAQAQFLDAIYTGQTFIGLVYAILGAPEPAAAALEQLIAKTHAPGIWLAAPYAALVLLDADLGKFDEAQAAHDAAEKFFAEQANPSAQLFFGIATAHWKLAEGNPAAALVTMQENLAKQEAIRIRPFRPMLKYYQALALEKTGKPAETEAALSDALNESRALGSRAYLWNILAALARLGAVRGDAGAAQDWKQKARTEVEFLAEHAPADLRAGFLNRADVREIMS